MVKILFLMLYIQVYIIMWERVNEDNILLKRASTISIFILRVYENNISRCCIHWLIQWHGNVSTMMITLLRAHQWKQQSSWYFISENNNYKEMCEDSSLNINLYVNMLAIYLFHNLVDSSSMYANNLTK